MFTSYSIVCPGTEAVAYNPSEETLEFGGEEGWDVDVCAWDADDAARKDDIQQLLEQEWKPAYDLVYYCSPFLRPLSATGKTLAEVNADTATFRSGTGLLDGGRKNELLTLYDEEYRLVYYSNAAGKYVVMGKEEYDMLAWLGLTGTPTWQELVAARKAKFRAGADSYWSVDDACYHDCFCQLIGASDNHAKNSYPFKFKTLAQGGRWCWRQDDLDTILATDNNGNQTKSYSVEPQDLTAEGSEVFQGSSSAFWTLIEDVFADNMRSTMTKMLNWLAQRAADLGLMGSGTSSVHERVERMLGEYFWGQSARYFPATAYNEDATWAYLAPWLLSPTQKYNDVLPLTQALGDQLEAERRWLELRVLYVMSRWGYGAFGDTNNTDGYGSFNFTSVKAFTFRLVPAVDMYPCAGLQGQLRQFPRTRAGEVCEVQTSPNDSTVFELRAMDWLADLGDLSTLQVTNRGGDASAAVSLSPSGKRLRRLKVGDAVAGSVTTNIGGLQLGSCPALEEIDARNVTSLSQAVSLTECPRLRRVLFEGCEKLPGLTLPAGAKVAEVSFPDHMPTLMLHSLPLLTTENMKLGEKALRTVETLYLSGCPGLDPLGILRSILQAQSGNVTLKFVTVRFGEARGTSADLELLAQLAAVADGYAAYSPDSRSLTGVSDARAIMDGSLTVSHAYHSTWKVLSDYFAGSLRLTVSDGWYVDFADDQVKQICMAAWGDGTGVTETAAAAVTNLDSRPFYMKDSITTFDELAAFTGLTQLTNCYTGFYQCKNLTSIDLRNLTAVGSTSQGTGTLQGIFRGCEKLASLGDTSRITELGIYTFAECYALKTLSFPAAVTVGMAFVKMGDGVTIDLGESLQTLSAWQYQTTGTLIVRATTPPALTDTGNNVLGNFDIYVPDAAVAAYKAATGWKDVASKIRPLSERE